jgi:hypothetical protein
VRLLDEAPSAMAATLDAAGCFFSSAALDSMSPGSTPGWLVEPTCSAGERDPSHREHRPTTQAAGRRNGDAAGQRRVASCSASSNAAPSV